MSSRVDGPARFQAPDQFRDQMAKLQELKQETECPRRKIVPSGFDDATGIPRGTIGLDGSSVSSRVSRATQGLGWALPHPPGYRQVL